MRKIGILISSFVLVMCIESVAGQMRVSRLGLHGGLLAGGDNEDSAGTFGGQVEVDLGNSLSFELAVSHFTDGLEDEGVALDMDLTTIGLSITGRRPIQDNFMGYALAGLNYNIPDGSATVDPSVAGMPVSATFDVDNEVGFHAGAGVVLALESNWELFLEYRYTIVDFDFEVEVSALGYSAGAAGGGDYNFGMLKIGANRNF